MRVATCFSSFLFQCLLNFLYTTISISCWSVDIKVISLSQDDFSCETSSDTKHWVLLCLQHEILKQICVRSCRACGFQRERVWRSLSPLRSYEKPRLPKQTRISWMWVSESEFWCSSCHIRPYSRFKLHVTQGLVVSLLLKKCIDN